MSIHLRKHISSKLKDLTPVSGCIAKYLQLKQNVNGQYALKLPLKDVKELKGTGIGWKTNFQHESIEDIEISNSDISFVLNKKALVENAFRNPTNVRVNENPSTFIVEFSSPNIAKPFHMGHLRSTIIGSFLSNLLMSINNKVIKMNYLGDYGTQFGFLKIGIEMEKLSPEQIKANPIECLFKAYVTANNSSDPTIAERARKVFETMENSEDDQLIKQWEHIKEYTMDELRIMYARLNVVYDVFEFESMYRRSSIDDVIRQLKEKNLLIEEDGKMVVEVGDRRIPIVKSDSTTLYLTRDIAAFLNRKQHYEVDKILYVVDNGQNDHFKAISCVVANLGYDAENLIQHVKFGRIRGMSTRKGSVVFLKDILNEAKELMYLKQQEAATTKVDLSECGGSVADILGTSAVIVNDLKQRRQRDYDFNWNKIMQMNGDTGVKLQYTHCRLFNLNSLSGKTEAENIDLGLLQEPEAQRLLFEILRYPEVIYDCTKTLESCGLVNYLFGISNSTSRALKVLQVKNCDSDDVASQRLLLFNTSRKILKHGLEILGLQVLNEM